MTSTWTWARAASVEQADTANALGRELTLVVLGASLPVGALFVRSAVLELLEKRRRRRRPGRGDTSLSWAQLAAAVMQLANQVLSLCILLVPAANVVGSCAAFLTGATSAYICFQLLGTSVLVLRATRLLPKTWAALYATTAALLPSTDPVGQLRQPSRRFVPRSACLARAVAGPRAAARTGLLLLFAVAMGLVAHSSYLKPVYISSTTARCASRPLWTNAVGKLLLCVVHGAVLALLAHPLLVHLRSARRTQSGDHAVAAMVLREMLKDHTARLSVAILVYLVTAVVGLASVLDANEVYILFSFQNAAGMWAATAASAAAALRRVTSSLNQQQGAVGEASSKSQSRAQTNTRGGGGQRRTSSVSPAAAAAPLVADTRIPATVLATTVLTAPSSILGDALSDGGEYWSLDPIPAAPTTPVPPPPPPPPSDVRGYVMLTVNGYATLPAGSPTTAYGLPPVAITYPPFPRP
ncbi:hypothetical protein H9P43_002336 [Blastocladiella emersonii ATCC 22665]|nr:hypothetical protein H9P43_002336 [Blastocladiella emersonii ATCC 22665]